MRPETIAVIKPCCIGDAVMSLPAISALHHFAPEAKIHVLTGMHNRAIFESHPAVSSIEKIPDVPDRHAIGSFVRTIRSVSPDWVALLDRSRLLRMLVRASGAERIATMDRPINGDIFRHEIDLYLDALRQFGIEATKTTPHMEIPKEDQAIARSLLSNVRRPYVAIQAGGALNPGSVMVEKRWPVDRYIELTRRMLAEGHDVVLTGGESDRARCEQIITQVNDPRVHLLAGKASLLVSAAVIQEAALYVGGDTGLSHIAAAVGTPVVAIFGPTNPLRYAPRGRRVRIIAPPASFRLPDRDLRKSPVAPPDARCDLVTTSEVIAACETLIRETTVIG